MSETLTIIFLILFIYTLNTMTVYTLKPSSINNPRQLTKRHPEHDTDSNSTIYGLMLL